MDSEELPIYKISMIGPSSTGKTSILNSFHKGFFDEDSNATIGANFISHVVQVGNEKIELQIWDTAGQEKYKSITPQYYRGSQCCIGVYSAVPASSRTELEKYLEDFHTYNDLSAMCVIVCNKIDLLESDQAPAITQGRDFAEISNYPFFAVSAKTGEGIKEMFQFVSETLLERERMSNTDEKIPAKKNDGCC